MFASSPTQLPDSDSIEVLAEGVFTESACSQLLLQQVLQRVGDKWSMLTIGTLRNGPLRFSEIRRAVPGISQRMLTRTLRALERDGLISRTVYAEIPARVVYELTDLGTTLIAPVVLLAGWALKNADHIANHRTQYDSRNESAG